jgi:hypothetical protein
MLDPLIDRALVALRFVLRHPEIGLPIVFVLVALACMAGFLGWAGWQLLGDYRENRDETRRLERQAYAERLRGQRKG